MALLKFKRSAVPAKVPSIADLDLGELAINTYDGKVYTKKDDGTQAIVEVGGNSSGITTITSTDGSVTVTGSGATRDLSVAVAGSTTNVLALVRNNTGATLAKGTVVYINGSLGQNSTVAKAIATSDATSAQTLGLMTANLANNATGYVTVIGVVTGMDTSAFTDGQQLYLSPTTAGTFTATKPYAPSHLVYVAVVEHAHPTQGKLFVKVQNGYEMDELHDVSAQSPANNDGLFYNTSTSLWEKKSIVTALGYTPYNATNPSGYITSSALSPYLTSSTAASTYQPLDGDLTAIAALAGTTGFVKKTAANTYTLDTATYLTGITSGQVTTALGYTPYNATNPAGYTTNTGTVTSVGGTGTVSGLTLSGTVTGSGNLTLGGTLSLTSGNVTTALGYTPYNAANPAGYITSSASITGNAATVTSITANTGLGRNSLSSGIIDVLTTTNFRTTMFGNTAATYNIATSRWNSVPTAFSGLGAYGTAIAWSGNDTHAFLALNYNSAGAKIGGGSADNINWSADLLHSSNYTSYAMPSGSSATNSVDVRAPIFYDSNNTAYYIDAAGTSVLRGLTLADGSASMTFSSTTSGRSAAFGMTDAYNMYLNAPSGGSLYLSNFSAPIFYDSNNTGYYVDPNSTSNLYRLGSYTAAQYNSGDWNAAFQNTPTQSYGWHGDVSSGGPAGTWWFYESMRHSNSSNYWGTQIAWGWEDNANRLQQRNVTGGSFGGWVEYLNTSNRTYSGNLNMTGSIISTASDVRAPIFYDQNNTGYYLDASSTGTSLNVAGSIVAAGNVTAYSDIRIKANVETIPSALDKLDLIRGVTYTRTDLDDKEQRYAGVIAQEIEAVLPEAVRDLGNIKAVDYNATIALLIQAVKELRDEVEALRK